MDLKNDIKVIGSFQKAVNALYAAITVIRIAAVAFLILQTVVPIWLSHRHLTEKLLRQIVSTADSVQPFVRRRQLP